VLPDRPPLPGAVGVSHLMVYDSEGPDGLSGGTPHLHTVCSEAYAMVSGSGVVQTLSPAGFVEVPLPRGAFVWFTPGTVHRLVNLDGKARDLRDHAEPRFRAEWERGPAQAAAATAAQLDALEDGETSHLDRASVHAFESPPEPRRPGCCGTLGTFVP
jgi:mannose-6-phosphate isomerase-like protein (cupin superfamily)